MFDCVCLPPIVSFFESDFRQSFFEREATSQQGVEAMGQGQVPTTPIFAVGMLVDDSLRSRGTAAEVASRANSFCQQSLWERRVPTTPLVGEGESSI